MCDVVAKCLALRPNGSKFETFLRHNTIVAIIWTLKILFHRVQKFWHATLSQPWPLSHFLEFVSDGKFRLTHFPAVAFLPMLARSVSQISLAGWIMVSLIASKVHRYEKRLSLSVLLNDSILFSEMKWKNEGEKIQLIQKWNHCVWMLNASGYTISTDFRLCLLLFSAASTYEYMIFHKWLRVFIVFRSSSFDFHLYIPIYLAVSAYRRYGSSVVSDLHRRIDLMLSYAIHQRSVWRPWVNRRIRNSLCPLIERNLWPVFH